MSSKSEEQFEAFEWDEAKRRANIEEHAIDFEDAADIFSRPYLRIRSDRNDALRGDRVHQGHRDRRCVHDPGWCLSHHLGPESEDE